MDLTTIGVKVGFATETTKGQKPTVFEWLKRCKAVAGINLSNETIDVTALEDMIRQYASGIADTGGEWPLTFGLNNEVVDALTAMRTKSLEAKKNGLATWFVVWFPDLKDAFYVIAEPGMIPMPDIAVGAAAEIQVPCTINEYKGLDKAIEPTEATSGTTTTSSTQ